MMTTIRGSTGSISNYNKNYSSGDVYVGDINEMCLQSVADNTVADITLSITPQTAGSCYSVLNDEILDQMREDYYDLYEKHVLEAKKAIERAIIENNNALQGSDFLKEKEKCKCKQLSRDRENYYKKVIEYRLKTKEIPESLYESRPWNTCCLLNYLNIEY